MLVKRLRCRIRKKLMDTGFLDIFVDKKVVEDKNRSCLCHIFFPFYHTPPIITLNDTGFLTMSKNLTVS